MTILATTRPLAAPCPRCHRLQLTGLEEGLPYRVEPAPLHAQAELAARLAGRRTYALIAGRLAYRNPERIRGDAHRGRPPVFADHRCEHPTQPGDVDPTHLDAVHRLLATVAPRPGEDPAVEADALDLFATELGARALVVLDRPPF